jgi:hypothetical protein
MIEKNRKLLAEEYQSNLEKREASQFALYKHKLIHIFIQHITSNWGWQLKYNDQKFI